MAQWAANEARASKTPVGPAVSSSSSGGGGWMWPSPHSADLSASAISDAFACASAPTSARRPTPFHRSVTLNPDLSTATASPRYNPRRAYRSVVCRTWKVGNARELLSSSSEHAVNTSDSEEPRAFAARPSAPSIYATLAKRPKEPSPAPNSQLTPRMCASSDNFWDGDVGEASTAFSTPRFPSAADAFSPPILNRHIGKHKSTWRDELTLSDADVAGNGNGDCFSSQDYLRFTHRPQPPPAVASRIGRSTDDESGAESEMEESIQSVTESFAELRHYASLHRPASVKKRRGPTRGQLFHKRSQSAGSNAVYSAVSPPTSPPPSQPPKAFRAPKSPSILSKSPSGLLSASPNPLGFLKRFYKSVNNNQGSHSIGFHRRKSKEKPPESLLSPPNSPHPATNGHANGAPRTLPRKLSPPRLHRTLSHDADAALRVNGTRPLHTAPAPDQFGSWEDAFQHLKTELSSMRLGDRAILRRFQVLEAELRCVKAADAAPSPIVEAAPTLELPTPTADGPPSMREEFL